MTTGESKSRIFAVVLAAGGSTRFGSNKMLARAGGRTLVRRAADTAHAVCGTRSLLVAGADAGDVIRAAGDAAGFVIVNDRYADGLGTSIAAGVAAVARAADAVLLMLADQALVPAAHLSSMICLWSGAADAIVATAFDDTVGPPVLFPRGTFAELVKLDRDDGARALLHDPRFTIETLRCDAAAVDIDTPDDLAAV